MDRCHGFAVPAPPSRPAEIVSLAAPQAPLALAAAAQLGGLETPAQSIERAQSGIADRVARRESRSPDASLAQFGAQTIGAGL